MRLSASTQVSKLSSEASTHNATALTNITAHGKSPGSDQKLIAARCPIPGNEPTIHSIGGGPVPIAQNAWNENVPTTSPSRGAGTADRRAIRNCMQAIVTTAAPIGAHAMSARW